MILVLRLPFLATLGHGTKGRAAQKTEGRPLGEIPGVGLGWSVSRA